eukprot:CAMPEP_0203945012 /NCGR_PEP_ID=MMETSP0359-20131031/80633_1 /ASSEMBLY_ACC=CAM_ASM_000338 /TAXON_ID=268821 /ORGANISM="Scrippsiella Hangoei, Strain SHTV-5" /LENGTH=974 /DNA_ID=CAMNT_0050876113 /DNA_START=78 /DNA_END=2998 /DNA_ORIENTATION=+
MADMQDLARLLSSAHAPGPQMSHAAEQLFQCESHVGFGIVLLQLVQTESMDLGIRQAGSIYFKNYLKRRWGPDRGIPDNEKEVIKESLLPLTLRVPRLLRAQFLGALQEMAGPEFLSDWPQLLSELSRLLASAQDDVLLQAVAMDAAHAVFSRYRVSGKGGDPVREARSCAEAFGPAHLQVWKAACERALSGTFPVEQLVGHWELLSSAVSVFYDLHAQVLPNFFCDQREAYLEGFIALLGCRGSGSLDSGSLASLQGEVCSALTLYASRYEEQLGAHVGRCTKAVWDLLTAIGQREEFDSLAGAGIAFLTAASRTEWESSPFQDPTALQAICEHIVLPNMKSRPSDVELFLESPQEYIVRDVEGGDEETRRRSAMDLVRALRRFSNAKVCEVLSTYAGQLLEQAKSANEEQALLCLDACVHVVIAMAGPANTADGLNASIVEQFFTSQVAPELQAEQLPKQRELLRASCLKFVTVLRTVLPAPCVLGILPSVSKHILAENPVIHTYAALCANLVSSMQEPGQDGQRRNRFDAQTLRPCLAPMVMPMLHILVDGRGIPQNEWVARALVAIISSLEAAAVEIAAPALQALARVIADVLAPRPANAECCHAVFECCSVLLKLLVPAGAPEVEGIFLPALGRVWEQGVEELLPYCFQVLGLVLDLTPSPSQCTIYVELLRRVLAEDLWRLPGNVPGIIRLLRAYFAKHAVFGTVLRDGMQTIFERFQYALGHQKLGGSAFALLNAILRYLPPDFYHQYFHIAITLSLGHLQGKKYPELEKEFVISMSLFVWMQQDPQALPRMLEQIQPGLLLQIVKNIWLPSAPKVLLLQRRKVCVVGLARLMTCTEIHSNPQVLGPCCECLAGLLKWRNAGLMCWLSSVLLPKLLGDEPTKVSQYETTFVRLYHCEPALGPSTGLGWDMLPEIQERATGLQVVREALEPIRPAIQALEKMPPSLAEDIPKALRGIPKIKVTFNIDS